jgi:hypothetical protein
MFKDPSHAAGIASGIACSSHGIKSEANAENSADRPVRTSVAEKVEQYPSRNHGDDRNRFRMRRSCQSQGYTRGQQARNLHRISGDDGEASEDFALKEQNDVSSLGGHGLVIITSALPALNELSSVFALMAGIGETISIVTSVPVRGDRSSAYTPLKV